jgi:Fe-S cluster assembly ATP-binding protein
MLVSQARMTPFLERDINRGLSGGEIKRSELLQLLTGQPRLAMMDEPDSGVDLESLAIVGEMINSLFSQDSSCPVKRRAALIITHTGHILDYVQADKAHIMLNGTIACSGNPHLILDIIREHGYEECARCIREGAYNL